VPIERSSIKRTELSYNLCMVWCGVISHILSRAATLSATEQSGHTFRWSIHAHG